LFLEPKEKMKDRGVDSPDYGDALALTFAQPVGPSRRPVKAEAQYVWESGTAGLGWMA
jgi:hypothetical protein